MSASLASASSQYFTSPFVLDPNAGGFSYAMWVKASSFNSNASGQNALIQQIDGGGTGRGWLYAKRNAGSDHRVASFFGAETLGSSNVFSDIGSWILVGGSVPAGGGNVTHLLYRNGSSEGSLVVNPEVCTGAMRYGAHKSPSSTNDYWNGKVAEIAIWNMSLSGTDWTSLWNSGAGTPATNVQSGNLIRYWPLISAVTATTGPDNLTGVNSPTFDAGDHPVTHAGGSFVDNTPHILNCLFASA
jgi:hypothetical protein